MMYTAKHLQNKRLKRLEKKLNQKPVYISYKDWDEICREFDETDGNVKFTQSHKDYFLSELYKKCKNLDLMPVNDFFEIFSEEIDVTKFQKKAE